MMENGRMVCCTAKDNTLGQMVESTKVNLKKNKNTVKVCINGPMVRNTMVVGSKVNNMAKLILRIQKAKLEKEDGNKASAKNG